MTGDIISWLFCLGIDVTDIMFFEQISFLKTIPFKNVYSECVCDMKACILVFVSLYAIRADHVSMSDGQNEYVTVVETKS